MTIVVVERAMLEAGSRMAGTGTAMMARYAEAAAVAVKLSGVVAETEM